MEMSPSTVKFIINLVEIFGVVVFAGLLFGAAWLFYAIPGNNFFKLRKHEKVEASGPEVEATAISEDVQTTKRVGLPF
jgi:hypothetical protein